LREEAGVEADLAGFAGYRELLLRNAAGSVGNHFVILAFAARWRAGEAHAGSELTAVEWIEPGTLARFKTTEGLAEIIETARRLVGI
jgi:hypothetical protein